MEDEGGRGMGGLPLSSFNQLSHHHITVVSQVWEEHDASVKSEFRLCSPWFWFPV